MRSKIKRSFLSLMLVFCLVGMLSTTRAQVLTLDSCVYNLGKRCLKRDMFFLNHSAYPLARAAVLQSSIERIKKIFEERKSRGLSFRVDDRLRDYLIANFSEIDFELRTCLHYSKNGKHILESLNNMRVAYIKIYIRMNRIVDDTLRHYSM